MLFTRCCFFLVGILFFLNSQGFAANVDASFSEKPSLEVITGSWIFSGTVTNESGDKYGYFFEIQRQGQIFHAKAALIDGRTNQLAFFYEEKQKIKQNTSFDWHVGYSFIQYNPINDSWVFGVKTKEKKGFNFKVDMLKQNKQHDETLILRPGVTLQALQTNQLNGHIQVDEKEQFVTANKAWFGKLILSNDQKSPHDINTTFCRLSDDNGFYSANLKENDATGAAVAGWYDPTGHRIKMSQFISIKLLEDNQCELHVGLPKLSLKLINSLTADNSEHAIAGFSKEQQDTFCFTTNQTFQDPSALA